MAIASGCRAGPRPVPAIVDIANHPVLGTELAFRGGTSLQKLHLPRSVRYSNDLDYVRTTRGPAKDLMAAVREVAVHVGLLEARYASKSDTITMHFDAEPTGGVGRIRVKIEINVREVEPAFDHLRASYRVDTPFAGAADVLTFELEEPGRGAMSPSHTEPRRLQADGLDPPVATTSS